jgi:hypothetical protein
MLLGSTVALIEPLSCTAELCTIVAWGGLMGLRSTADSPKGFDILCALGSSRCAADTLLRRCEKQAQGIETGG